MIAWIMQPKRACKQQDIAITVQIQPAFSKAGQTTWDRTNDSATMGRQGALQCWIVLSRQRPSASRDYSQPRIPAAKTAKPSNMNALAAKIRAVR